MKAGGYARFSFTFDVGGRCDMVCDHCTFSVEIEPETLLVDLIDAADSHLAENHPWPPAPSDTPQERPTSEQ